MENKGKFKAHYRFSFGWTDPRGGPVSKIKDTFFGGAEKRAGEKITEAATAGTSASQQQKPPYHRFKEYLARLINFIADLLPGDKK